MSYKSFNRIKTIKNSKKMFRFRNQIVIVMNKKRQRLELFQNTML